MQCVIDLFDKHDEGSDVAVAEAGARVVLLELVDQPARIINADVKLIVRPPERAPG